jgi:hypothetical protein
MSDLNNIRALEFASRIGPAGAEDWVLVSNRTAMSDTGQYQYATWYRVAELMPSEKLKSGMKADFVRARWQRIEPAWKAWRETNEIPDEGTPLTAWAGVTAQEAETLRAMGVKTVEDLATMPEGNVAAARLPNTRRLREMAQTFLSSQPQADAQRRIETLEAQLAEAVRMLSEKAEAAGPADWTRDQCIEWLTENGHEVDRRRGDKALREQVQAAMGEAEAA